MKITVEYEIEDGYVGGRRPQHMTVYSEDYEDLTEEQIREQLADEIQEHFLQNRGFAFEVPVALKELVKK